MAKFDRALLREDSKYVFGTLLLWYHYSGYSSTVLLF